MAISSKVIFNEYELCNLPQAAHIQVPWDRPTDGGFSLRPNDTLAGDLVHDGHVAQSTKFSGPTREDCSAGTKQSSTNVSLHAWPLIKLQHAVDARPPIYGKIIRR